MIEAGSLDGASHGDDAGFQELLASLHFAKCPVTGYTEAFNDALLAMERVKNEVRGGYHRHMAQKNYEELDATVKESGQSTNYELVVAGGGRERLSLRVREAHVRSAEAQSHQLMSVEAFVKRYASNIGCHPFLAGLRTVLQANLANETVVGWTCSDAVFVESGMATAQASIQLLIRDLNFGHHVASDPTEHAVRFRSWCIDPYMSDNDILQILKRLPSPSQLESRGTGDHQPTTLTRQNLDGAYDEHQSFFQKWCVIL